MIDENSEQLGIMSLPEALALAKSKGLDLVEIAAAANPPVCRLIDYAKLRYEQKKEDVKKKPESERKPPSQDDTDHGERGFAE